MARKVQVAENILCFEDSLQVPMMTFPLRATCIKMQDGRVLLHSPVSFTEDDVEEIREFGQVEWVVAPNQFHHLYIKKAQECFPKARFLHATGLEKKRQDISFHGSIREDVFPEEIQVFSLEGMPKFEEVVFFHQPTRTLLVTDLFFNLKNVQGWSNKWITKLSGTYNKLTISRIFKLMIKDKEAFDRSYRKVLEWPFDRIILSHGEIVENEARALVKNLR